MCFCVCVCVNCSVVSNSLLPHELWPTNFLCPWNSPGKNAEVGSHSLLQGIFLIQGSNPGLLHCRWILYQLSHKGSPRILEWVAYPFSRGSFQPRKELGSPGLQADSLPSELSGKPYNTCSTIQKHELKLPPRQYDTEYA